jgi:hypothetical protein
MKNNYIAQDASEEDDARIYKHHLNGTLHPEFLPMTTYDMVQLGLPTPDHGGMVVRVDGGTDENGILRPSTGMWMKVEDFHKYLELTNGMEGIRRINTMFHKIEIPVTEPQKKISKSKKKKKSKK